MFQFQHIDHLWALFALPLLLLTFMLWQRTRRRRERAFGELELLRRLVPGISLPRRRLKLSLVLAALALLIIGWANPQWGSRAEVLEQQSSDIFIALDISQSMLAEDISPNRMDRARQFALSLIRQLRGERVGLILFAGSAFIQMPLTTDYAAAEVFIRAANPSLSSVQGTAIGQAIEKALQGFDLEEPAGRLLIIISDGESHDREMEVAADKAREAGVGILTVGAGTQEGSTIPVPSRSGRPQYKRDREGKPVVSHLEEEMLRELAKKCGGRYFNIREGEAILQEIDTYVDKLEKSSREERTVIGYESYFHLLLWPALLLLLLDFFLPFGKRSAQTVR